VLLEVAAGMKAPRSTNRRVNDARERGGNFGELEQCFGTIEIGFCHLAFGPGCVDGQGNNEVGRFLLSLGKTRKLEMSDLDFGLVLGAVGEEFGDFNVGKKISFFYPISFVDGDVFKVTADLCVEGGAW